MDPTPALQALREAIGPLADELRILGTYPAASLPGEPSSPSLEDERSESK